MSNFIPLGAASRRPIFVAAIVMCGAASAFAQTRPPADTARKAAPPAAQVKGAAAPTGQTKGAPAPTGQTKGAPAPTGQTKGAAAPTGQTKGAVAPTGQTKGAVAPTGQTKGAVAPTGQTRASATPPQQTGAGPRAGRGAPGLNVVMGDTASAAPLIMMREVFEYDRDGRRDPFISLLSTTDLRPTLSDLTLLMTVVDEPGRSIALVSNFFDKKQKTVRVGDRLGRMRVSSIRADVVVFTIEEFGSNRRDSLLLRDSTKVRGR